MIQIRALTKRYGGVLAVDDLTFDVTPGAVTGFLGANGAGKSTTMRMVLGLDAPTSGTATVAGRAYRELAAPAREVGALLDPQRVGIAGALLGDPGVLVLDEPLNGLDPQGIAWIRTLLRDLAAQGRTVFVSSHLMHEMEQTAQRVVVIGKGRLIDSRDVAELRGRTTTVHARAADARENHRLGTVLAGSGVRVTATGDGLAAQGATPEQIGRLAQQHGIALGALTVAASGLEESFLALTAEAS